MEGGINDEAFGVSCDPSVTGSNSSQSILQSLSQTTSIQQQQQQQNSSNNNSQQNLINNHNSVVQHLQHVSNQQQQQQTSQINHHHMNQSSASSSASLLRLEQLSSPTSVSGTQSSSVVTSSVNNNQFNQPRVYHSNSNNSNQQLTSGPLYKEPLYMFYDDSYRSRPEENIYEEVDLLTLNSLRAQYSDTLSLQSWNKKNGGHRSKSALSSAASSSFSRWFSTRKKSPLVAGGSSTGVSSSELDSHHHHHPMHHSALHNHNSQVHNHMVHHNSHNPHENPYMDPVKLSKKQRPPISLPDIPPDGLTQEQLKRRLILSAIVESENSYINSLHRLINEYKKPLEESAPSILSQNKINVIFYRLEQILQCHAIFGIALNQCVREWDLKERIGDVFIASFSKTMVLDIYSDFINNFTQAMETARKSSKSKSAFSSFLQEKSLTSHDRLSLFGLMVKPVQRFPQFILLLNDLLKHTPNDHPDRMSLQLALTQLESLADRLNERKRDAERHFAVKQLLKEYLSSSTTSSTNRYLLRMDEVYLLDLDASTGVVNKVCFTHNIITCYLMSSHVMSSYSSTT